MQLPSQLEYKTWKKKRRRGIMEINVRKSSFYSHCTKFCLRNWVSFDTFLMLKLETNTSAYETNILFFQLIPLKTKTLPIKMYPKGKTQKTFYTATLFRFGCNLLPINVLVRSVKLALEVNRFYYE